MSECVSPVIRTPDQRLRVFVSSTRQEVAESLLKTCPQLHLLSDLAYGAANDHSLTRSAAAGTSLGHGGVGTVYRAFDTLHDRAVVVNVVSNSAWAAGCALTQDQAIEFALNRA